MQIDTNSPNSSNIVNAENTQMGSEVQGYLRYQEETLFCIIGDSAKGHLINWIPIFSYFAVIFSALTFSTKLKMIQQNFLQGQEQWFTTLPALTD